MRTNEMPPHKFKHRVVPQHMHNKNRVHTEWRHTRGASGEWMVTHISKEPLVHIYAITLPYHQAGTKGKNRAMYLCYWAGDRGGGSLPWKRTLECPVCVWQSCVHIFSSLSHLFKLKSASQKRIKQCLQCLVVSIQSVAVDQTPESFRRQEGRENTWVVIGAPTTWRDKKGAETKEVRKWAAAWEAWGTGGRVKGCKGQTGGAEEARWEQQH